MGTRVGLEVLVVKKIFLDLTGIRATDHSVRSLVTITTMLPWLPDYDLRQNYFLKTYKKNTLKEQVVSRGGCSDSFRDIPLRITGRITQASLCDPCRWFSPYPHVKTKIVSYTRL